MVPPASCRACRWAAACAWGTTTSEAPALSGAFPQGPGQREAVSQHPHTWLGNAGCSGGVPALILLQSCWVQVHDIARFSDAFLVILDQDSQRREDGMIRP
jgi:hypothetical protein